MVLCNDPCIIIVWYHHTSVRETAAWTASCCSPPEESDEGQTKDTVEQMRVFACAMMCRAHSTTTFDGSTRRRVSHFAKRPLGRLKESSESPVSLFVNSAATVAAEIAAARIRIHLLLVFMPAVRCTHHSSGSRLTVIFKCSHQISNADFQIAKQAHLIVIVVISLLGRSHPHLFACETL